MELLGLNATRCVWRRKNADLQPREHHTHREAWGCFLGLSVALSDFYNEKCLTNKFSIVCKGDRTTLLSKAWMGPVREVLWKRLLSSVKALRVKRGWILQLYNDPKCTTWAFQDPGVAKPVCTLQSSREFVEGVESVLLSDSPKTSQLLRRSAWKNGPKNTATVCEDLMCLTSVIASQGRLKTFVIDQILVFCTIIQISSVANHTMRFPVLYFFTFHLLSSICMAFEVYLWWTLQTSCFYISVSLSLHCCTASEELCWICLICRSLQAGEENPVVYLSVVSLNGPLHTVVMKKPDDPRIGWVMSLKVARCPYPITSNKHRSEKQRKVIFFPQSFVSVVQSLCVFSRREYYITMVKWATSTKLAVNWLNRAQNNSILTLCEATTGVCIKVKWIA